MQKEFECGLNVVVCGPYDEAVEGLRLCRMPLPPLPPKRERSLPRGLRVFGRATLRARGGLNPCGQDAKPYHPPPTITPRLFLCATTLWNDLCNRNKLPSYAGIF